MKSRIAFLFSVIVILFVNGCTVHIDPPLFDIDTSSIKQFQGNSPVTVVVPQKADEEYFIEYADLDKSSGKAKVYVDLNVMYKNAKELIEKQLSDQNVPVSQSAEKYLKFTITKIQWEVWGMGFVMGSYLEFDIETGDGYSAHYRVQDQSGHHVERAVGGTISRAVEKIFQDDKVIEYIEKNKKLSGY
jgi:hypothetical protein